MSNTHPLHDSSAHQYTPITFTADDGTRILVALFLPPEVQPLIPTLAFGYETDLGHRWGPPIAADPT